MKLRNLKALVKNNTELLSRYATMYLKHRDDQAHRHRRQNTLVSRCYLMWH